MKLSFGLSDLSSVAEREGTLIVPCVCAVCMCIPDSSPSAYPHGIKVSIARAKDPPRIVDSVELGFEAS